MTRVLKKDEALVLSHVVTDPAAWWAHCQITMGERAEQCLADKVARWKPDYDATKSAAGYCTRAVRQEAEDAARAERLKQAAIDVQVAERARLRTIIKEIIAEG